MDIIWITTLVIAVIAVLVAAGLVYAGKNFAVKVDERVVAIRGKLPGNNCGACGYAGCDALAAAISAGEAPVNACPVGGGPVAEEIGDIMGTKAGAMERKTAFVACKGTCEVTKNQGNYTGIQDCRRDEYYGLHLRVPRIRELRGGLPGAGDQRCERRCGCEPEALRELRPVREDLPAGTDLADSGKPDRAGAVLEPGQGPGGSEDLQRGVHRMRPVREAVRIRRD